MSQNKQLKLSRIQSIEYDKLFSEVSEAIKYLQEVKSQADVACEKVLLDIDVDHVQLLFYEDVK